MYEYVVVFMALSQALVSDRLYWACKVDWSVPFVFVSDSAPASVENVDSRFSSSCQIFMIYIWKCMFY